MRTPRSTPMPPTAATPSSAMLARPSECGRVSRPMTTTPPDASAVAVSAATAASTAGSSPSSAFASRVAKPSHDWWSMPPSVSTSLIPLSGSGLCDAVTISPDARPPRARERSTASMPIR